MQKVFLFVGLLALVSCGDEPTKDNVSNDFDIEESEDVEFTARQLKELKTASKVVYTLPSPVEMAELLHETKAIYDVEILNDADAIDDYVTDIDRSLNLGVYFADLSFTSMFDYPQQAMRFMGAAQALCEELNIVGIFNEDVMMRLEENMSNKDSLMEIVASTYLETDLYLQDNDRPIVAKSILCGAWIEGLYIAVNLKTDADKEKEYKIWERIGEQKPALHNLIKMLEDLDNPVLLTRLKELKELETIFEEVNLEYDGSTKSETDTIQKVTKLVSKMEVKITEETFNKLKAKTTAIRNSITL